MLREAHGLYLCVHYFLEKENLEWSREKIDEN